MDVRDQVLPHGVLAVLHQEHPVELALDLGVGDAALLDPLLDVGMAIAVEGEVAYEAVQVRLARRAVRHTGETFAGGSEELPPRPVVHGETYPADGVPVQGVVVEQDVRPVQADVVQLPVPFDRRA